jgi:hypothetical protein
MGLTGRLLLVLVAIGGGVAAVRLASGDKPSGEQPREQVAKVEPPATVPVKVDKLTPLPPIEPHPGATATAVPPPKVPSIPLPPPDVSIPAIPPPGVPVAVGHDPLPTPEVPQVPPIPVVVPIGATTPPVAPKLPQFPEPPPPSPGAPPPAVDPLPKIDPLLPPPRDPGPGNPLERAKELVIPPPMPNLDPIALPKVDPAALPKVDPPPVVPAVVSKLKPLAEPPQDAARVYLSQTRVAVEYEVTKKGPSGLGMVELWVKDASGWSLATSAKSGDVVEAELPADGAYGAKVLPVSGQGVRGPAPAKDAEPDLWVVRDTAPPVVVVKVSPWTAPPKPASDEPDLVPKLPRIPQLPDPSFVVGLTATDANLACETLVVEWSEGDKSPPAALFTGKELAKGKIETKLGVFVPRKLPVDKESQGLKMLFDWTPAADVPPKVTFTVSAKDKAGNVGRATPASVGTDLTTPAARVTGVRGLPGR